MMKTNSELLHSTSHADLADLRALGQLEPRPTQYGIRMSVTGLWVGMNFHYEISSLNARTFSFMTPAIGYAICTLGLDNADFTVEAV
jgi:hypothetical protein